jgi:hypothetical protein
MVVVEHGRHVRGQVVNGLAVRAQVGHLLDRSRGRRYLPRETTSVADPDLNPDPLVRGMDPDPALDLDPDPSIIKQI